MLLTIVAFILILGLLILAHELGHYVTARLAGVKVEEFGIGYPPRIFGIKRGETIYSLNWIPLGGFCRLLGEEDPSEPRSLATKPAWVRLIVLGAGSFMNAILPIVLLTIAFMIPRDVQIGDVFIDEVALNSPAAEAGVEVGDRLLAVNGQEVQNIGDVIYEIHMTLGGDTTLSLENTAGVERTITVVPRWDPPEGEGAVGITMSMANIEVISQSYPFWEAVPKAGSTLWETFTLIRNEVASWFARGAAPEVAGPVGIFQLTGEASEAGPSYLVQFAAFLSLNLAFVNLFPIPGLDGGRIIFVLIEVARRGKRVAPRTEGLIHLAGFVLLIGLILVITVADIVRVAEGRPLIE
jgi:regulator of sigma E protease